MFCVKQEGVEITPQSLETSVKYVRKRDLAEYRLKISSLFGEKKSNRVFCPEMQKYCWGLRKVLKRGHIQSVQCRYFL